MGQSDQAKTLWKASELACSGCGPRPTPHSPCAPSSATSSGRAHTLDQRSACGTLSFVTTWRPLPKLENACWWPGLLPSRPTTRAARPTWRSAASHRACYGPWHWSSSASPARSRGAAAAVVAPHPPRLRTPPRRWQSPRARSEQSRPAQTPRCAEKRNASALEPQPP